MNQFFATVLGSRGPSATSRDSGTGVSQVPSATFQSRMTPCDSATESDDGEPISPSLGYPATADSGPSGADPAAMLSSPPASLDDTLKPLFERRPAVNDTERYKWLLPFYDSIARLRKANPLSLSKGGTLRAFANVTLEPIAPPTSQQPFGVAQWLALRSEWTRGRAVELQEAVRRVPTGQTPGSSQVITDLRYKLLMETHNLAAFAILADAVSQGYQVRQGHSATWHTTTHPKLKGTPTREVVFSPTGNWYWQAGTGVCLEHSKELIKIRRILKTCDALQSSHNAGLCDNFQQKYDTAVSVFCGYVRSELEAQNKWSDVSAASQTGQASQ